jgi:hypothetical protein
MHRDSSLQPEIQISFFKNVKTIHNSRTGIKGRKRYRVSCQNIFIWKSVVDRSIAYSKDHMAAQNIRSWYGMDAGFA